MRKRGRSVPRRLEQRHLPYVIHRRIWAQCITLLLVPVLATLPAFLTMGAIKADANFLAMLIVLLCSSVLLLGAIIALDRSIGYRLIIDADGFTTKGVLFTRHFMWGEISDIVARSNYRLPGYYASWTVDGSRHPRRHWSSLWFGFYEVPPLMQIGGKDLTRLLRHAKRRADSGWAASAPRATVSRAVQAQPIQ
jgi:hypothetical protein